MFSSNSATDAMLGSKICIPATNARPYFVYAIGVEGAKLWRRVMCVVFNQVKYMPLAASFL